VKRVLKYIGIGLGGLLLLAGSAVTVLLVKGPASRPPSTEKVEATHARLERGRYLAHNVMACFFCHGDRDRTLRVQQVKPGSEGLGQCSPDPFPGKLCFSNITSHPTAGLGAWTDGEVLRAIREGIGRDGRALVPVMPYRTYQHLSDEDGQALVAYLRTLAPKDTVVPPSEVDFPVSLLLLQFPKPLEGAVPPPSKEGVAHGRYMTAIAACVDCHGQDFSGGEMQIQTPLGVVVGANITPDKETGIGEWSRGVFISRFKSHLSMDTSQPATPKTTTEMPWLQYAGMTEEDLGAIYDYLMSQPPVRKQVVVRPDASAAQAANTGG
jgi:mono/diheme cytochrome c family protein